MVKKSRAKEPEDQLSATYSFSYMIEILPRQQELNRFVCYFKCG